MKKIILMAAVAALTLSSCSSVHHTATTKGVDTEIYNRSNAELKVADKRVSFTFVPTKAQQRAGEKSVKAAAVAALLAANGNADVLIAPEYEIKRAARGKIKSVTVTGRPGSYVAIHATTKAEAETINMLENPNAPIILSK